MYTTSIQRRGLISHRSAADTIQRAFALIDAVAEQPFFLVIHLFDPHFPYSALPPFRGVVHGRGGRLELHAPDHGSWRVLEWTNPRRWTKRSSSPPMTKRSRTRINNSACCATGSPTGACSRTAWSSLRRTTARNCSNTGGFGHAHALWQELLHVPLIFWGAGVNPGRDATPGLLGGYRADGAGLARPRVAGAVRWPVTRAHGVGQRAGAGPSPLCRRG